MVFLEISLVGTVESPAMTFIHVLDLVTKIVLTRQELPSTSPRTLRIPSLEVLGWGGSEYSQGKFGKPPACGETVRFVNNKPHAWCASCGWTTTHSAKFHDKRSTSKSTFVLHDKHSLTIAKQGGLKKGCPAKTKPKKLSEGHEKSKGGHDNPQSGLSLASLGEHFARMELSASNPTQANMAQLLKNLFQEKV